MLLAVHNIGEGFILNDQLDALYFAPLKPKPNPRSAKSNFDYHSRCLFHKSYLERHPVKPISKGRTNIGNFLDKEGIKEVANALAIPSKQLTNQRSNRKEHIDSWQYIHTVTIVDVQICFRRAAQFGNFKIVDWIGEKALLSRKMAADIPRLPNGQPKKPDSVFALFYADHLYGSYAPKPAVFFLEVDRSTESAPTFIQKALAYEHFRESGDAVKIYGSDTFRILTTVLNQDRLETLREKIIETVGKDKSIYYWFALQEHFDIWHPKNILDDIWQVPTYEGLYSLKTPVPDQIIFSS